MEEVVLASINNKTTECPEEDRGIKRTLGHTGYEYRMLNIEQLLSINVEKNGKN